MCFGCKENTGEVFFMKKNILRAISMAKLDLDRTNIKRDFY